MDSQTGIVPLRLTCEEFCNPGQLVSSKDETCKEPNVTVPNSLMSMNIGLIFIIDYESQPYNHNRMIIDYIID